MHWYSKEDRAELGRGARVLTALLLAAIGAAVAVVVMFHFSAWGLEHILPR